MRCGIWDVRFGIADLGRHRAQGKDSWQEAAVSRQPQLEVGGALRFRLEAGLGGFVKVQRFIWLQRFERLKRF